jgi:hypothetical protein
VLFGNESVFPDTNDQIPSKHKSTNGNYNRVDGWNQNQFCSPDRDATGLFGNVVQQKPREAPQPNSVPDNTPVTMKQMQEQLRTSFEPVLAKLDARSEKLARRRQDGIRRKRELKGVEDAIDRLELQCVQSIDEYKELRESSKSIRYEIDAMRRIVDGMYGQILNGRDAGYVAACND